MNIIRFPSTKPLRGFFDNLLFTETPQGKGSYSVIRYQARDFINAGIEQFIVALKKPEGPKDTFIDLTPHLDRTWKELLRGERIIEFPTLYIWLQGHMEDNDIKLEEKIFVEGPLPHQQSKPKGSKRQKKNNNHDAHSDQSVPSTTGTDEQVPEQSIETQQESVAVEQIDQQNEVAQHLNTSAIEDTFEDNNNKLQHEHEQGENQDIH